MSKKIRISVLVIIVNVLIDQLSKQWAQQSLKNAPTKSYWDDIFRLTYAENDGAFLSLGSGLSDELRLIILGIVPLIVLLAFMLYTFFSKEVDLKSAVAFGFIIGGGMSNIADRFLYGSVVDFMNMGLGTLRTGIFNIADLSIIAGIVLYILFSFQDAKAQENINK